MAATVVKEIVAITGKYQDRNGVEKNRYQKLGVVMEKDGKKMIKLEVIPLNWDGWAFLNDPKESDGNAQTQRPASQQAGVNNSMDEDDLPF